MVIRRIVLRCASPRRVLRSATSGECDAGFERRETRRIDEVMEFAFWGMS
jgi:hypothetical protein